MALPVTDRQKGYDVTKTAILAMPSARALALRAEPAPPFRPYGLRSTIASRAPIQVFRSDAQNICPGCGRSHWVIGRSSAECASCCTALPFAGWR